MLFFLVVIAILLIVLVIMESSSREDKRNIENLQSQLDTKTAEAKQLRTTCDSLKGQGASPAAPKKEESGKNTMVYVLHKWDQDLRGPIGVYSSPSKCRDALVKHVATVQTNAERINQKLTILEKSPTHVVYTLAEGQKTEICMFDSTLFC